MFDNFFPPKVTPYETMWKNMLQRDRAQMTTQRMRVACWMAKAAETHSEYVTFLIFHCNNG
jgi:hypothetical protein